MNKYLITVVLFLAFICHISAFAEGYYLDAYYIDADHVNDGCFTIASDGLQKEGIRLSVQKEGDMEYFYKLIKDVDVIPLQEGNGTYTITLYKNRYDDFYDPLDTISLYVWMEDENEVFLHPNQYVDYDEETNFEEILSRIEGLTTDEEIYDKICEYMSLRFLYDEIKREKVKPGMLPDVDRCLNEKMGVCQDLSAALAAVLRTCGIPSKLVIGYAGRNYHAWNETLINGEIKRYDLTAKILGIEDELEYKPERYY